MEDIGDILMERQKSLFVGRKTELEILERGLRDPEWKLLHLHGPGGIGKTTLLQRFARGAGPSRCLLLDGHRDFRNPRDYLLQLGRLLPSAADSSDEVDRLNAYAASRGGVMLLLDTFEKWGAIEDWLRTEFFPRLHPLVKISSAGRYPLEDRWERDGWGSVIRNVELQPLSVRETQAYAKARGIESRDIVASLQRFSNGLPLALSMACEIIVRKGSARFLNRHQQDRIVASLLEELTNDVEERNLKRYLEAASMVWRFDQELLQALLREPIGVEHFREFCRLPFVIRVTDGWSLHDSIRQWGFIEFRNRMPQAFHAYRRRALEALSERERLLPRQRTAIAFERLYLHELDFVRDFRFQWDDRLRFRECREHELESVERLYLDYLHRQTHFIPGDPHLESLIRPLWRIDPAAFYGLWRDRELVAFCSCIPLTEQTVPLFRSNPITAAAASRYRPDRRQFLLCLTGVAAHLEQDISGSVARALVWIIERNPGAELLNLLAIPYWQEYLPLLGFRRSPWADSTTPRGIPYIGHQLDLRHEDLSSRLNQMYAGFESAGTPERQSQTPLAKEQLSLDEAVKLVRQALKLYPRLPFSPEVVRSLQPLAPASAPDTEQDKLAGLIQENIRNIMDRFLDGSAEERRFRDILHHAYIKKRGTHEAVSEYLNIPIKSYYRYLKSAVRALAYEMVKARQGQASDLEPKV